MDVSDARIRARDSRARSAICWSEVGIVQGQAISERTWRVEIEDEISEFAGVHLEQYARGQELPGKLFTKIVKRGRGSYNFPHNSNAKWDQ